jgi:hypothetical protein
MQAPLYVRLGTSDWYVLEEVFLDKVYEPVNQRRLPDVRNIVDLGRTLVSLSGSGKRCIPVRESWLLSPDDENLQMCEYNSAESTGPRSIGTGSGVRRRNCAFCLSGQICWGVAIFYARPCHRHRRIAGVDIAANS